MADIYVKSSQSLQDLKDQLEELNGKVQAKAADLDSELKGLAQKWQGGASDAFQSRWTREYGNFDTLRTVVSDYVGALELILGRYETAEGNATSLASGSSR